MSKSAEIDNFSSSKDEVYSADVGEPQVVLASQTDSNRHSVQRGLKVRHIQLIAISGAIGAGVFISIGNPLVAAGPLALLIGIAIWSSVILAFSFCLIEMTTLLPLPGGYIYYSGRFLDPSIRFAQGWSTVLLGVAFVCFELTAMNVVVSFWAPDLHPAIVISAGLVVLMAINGLNVRYYGEVEFWISILKVLLMIGLFMFTFITMVGGNPLGDRYGFRYWRDPGLFAKPDVVGRLKGIWASVMWGAFAIAGPEFISMVAGETQSPRRVLPKAFNSTIYRVVFFYMGSALCVAINTPYNDPALLGAIAAGAPGAARSPYIINMNRLQVSVLPSLTNAVILTSILSTACSFTYSSSRALYSLGMEGQAPKFFTKTNRWGTPYVGVFTIGLFSCLSYLAVSSGTVKVLDWFVNLTTACTLLTWNTTGYTYLRFRAGLKAQRLENLLPVRGYLQPYAGYYATFMASFTLIFSGYTLFAPGAFSVPDFIFAYGAVFVYLFNFSFWKIKGVLRGEQRWFGIPAMEMDFTSDLDEIERITLEDEVAIEERKGKPETALQKIDRWLF